MNVAAARQMAQRTTFFGFDGFTWSADKCDAFRRNGKDLWDLVESIQRENPNLGFDVYTIDRDDKEGLLRQVGLLSPKLRHLFPLLAFITTILGEKVVIWLHYPWA